MMTFMRSASCSTCVARSSRSVLLCSRGGTGRDSREGRGTRAGAGGPPGDSAARGRSRPAARADVRASSRAPPCTQCTRRAHTHTHAHSPACPAAPAPPPPSCSPCCPSPQTRAEPQSDPAAEGARRGAHNVRQGWVNVWATRGVGGWVGGWRCNPSRAGACAPSSTPQPCRAPVGRTPTCLHLSCPRPPPPPHTHTLSLHTPPPAGSAGCAAGAAQSGPRCETHPAPRGGRACWAPHPPLPHPGSQAGTGHEAGRLGRVATEPSGARSSAGQRGVWGPGVWLPARRPRPTGAVPPETATPGAGLLHTHTFHDHHPTHTHTHTHTFCLRATAFCHSTMSFGLATLPTKRWPKRWVLMVLNPE